MTNNYYENGHYTLWVCTVYSSCTYNVAVTVYTWPITREIFHQSTADLCYVLLWSDPKRFFDLDTFRLMVNICIKDTVLETDWFIVYKWVNFKMFPKLCLSLVLPATNVVHVYSSYHSRHHILHFHVFYFIIYSSSYFRSHFPVNTRMAAEESYPELLFICLFWLLHAIFSLTEYIMAFCYLLSSKWRSVITQVCVSQSGAPLKDN